MKGTPYLIILYIKSLQFLMGIGQRKEKKIRQYWETKNQFHFTLQFSKYGLHINSSREHIFAPFEGTL